VLTAGMAARQACRRLVISRHRRLRAGTDVWLAMHR